VSDDDRETQEAKLRLRGRALTANEKRAVLERILEIWTRGDNRHLRLGQLIHNSIVHAPLYFIEDGELAEMIERVNRK
jgi:hypothetical protein